MFSAETRGEKNTKAIQKKKENYVAYKVIGKYAKIIKANSKQRSIGSNNVKLTPCWLQLETPKIFGGEIRKCRRKNDHILH